MTTFKPTTPKTIKTTSSPIPKEIHNLPSLLKINEISNEKTKGKCNYWNESGWIKRLNFGCSKFRL